MNITAVVITSIICATLIILNIIWTLNDIIEERKIEAKTRDTELRQSLKSRWKE